MSWAGGSLGSHSLFGFACHRFNDWPCRLQAGYWRFGLKVWMFSIRWCGRCTRWVMNVWFWGSGVALTKRQALPWQPVTKQVSSVRTRFLDEAGCFGCLGAGFGGGVTGGGVIGEGRGAGGVVDWKDSVGWPWGRERDLGGAMVEGAHGGGEEAQTGGAGDAGVENWNKLIYNLCHMGIGIYRYVG